MFRTITALSAVLAALAIAGPVVAGESCCPSKSSEAVVEVAKADLPAPTADAKAAEKSACCDAKKDDSSKTADKKKQSGCCETKKECPEKAKTETAASAPCTKSAEATAVGAVAASEAKPCCDKAAKSVEVAKAD